MSQKHISDSALRTLIVELMVSLRRNVTNWRDGFDEKELELLRIVWNDGLSTTDTDYWHKGD